MAKSTDIKPVLEFGGNMPEAETVKVTDLEGDIEGKIVWIEGLVLRETIEKAKVLGAKGMIAAGINYQDYRDLVKNGEEFPVAILGGFGVTK